MKLISFTVSKYRSIKEAYKIPIGSYAVLVGPNNEGKSNLLKALVVALNMLSPVRRTGIKDFSHNTRYEYMWERDYPISLQMNQPGGKSEFILEFELTDTESINLKDKIGILIESILKIKITVDSSRKTKFEILLRGPKKKNANAKIAEIAEFIHDKIKIEYIPAVRTSEFALDIIEKLLSAELETLESNQEYLDALKKIEELQKPILTRLGSDLRKTLSGFIPEIKKVDLLSGRRMRNLSRGGARIAIDDGTKTDLEFKGDGIKSLTAISLVRHMSQAALVKKNLILVIEEPEVHLHPKAIHRLGEVISELTTSHQVIITTHNPALVQRAHIGRNIMVENGRAEEAASMSDIRNSLGVHVSDNLTSAEIVLFVEGDDDNLILCALLSESPLIKASLSTGRLIVKSVKGASKLVYNLSFYKGLLCHAVVFLDDDQAGRDAANVGKSESLISIKDCFFTKAKGMSDSEFEDLFDHTMVKDFMLENYSVALDEAFFRKPKSVFSNRISSYFTNAGKSWDDDTEQSVKLELAKHAAVRGVLSIAEFNRPQINSLQSHIEVLLRK